MHSKIDHEFCSFLLLRFTDQLFELAQMLFIVFSVPDNLICAESDNNYYNDFEKHPVFYNRKNIHKERNKTNGNQQQIHPLEIVGMPPRLLLRKTNEQ